MHSGPQAPLRFSCCIEVTDVEIVDKKIWHKHKLEITTVAEVSRLSSCTGVFMECSLGWQGGSVLPPLT